MTTKKTPTPKQTPKPTRKQPSQAIITNKVAEVDPRKPKHVYTGTFRGTMFNVNGVMMAGATRAEIRDCEKDSRL